MKFITTRTALESVANAIRSLVGSVGTLKWPNGFVSALSGITKKAAATYTTSAVDQTIQSGQYLSGNQLIKGVKVTNLNPANVKTGVTVKVGDGLNDGRIASVEGEFTSDANATASSILSGSTAYAKGSKVTGTIPIKTSETFNVSGTDRAISEGRYLSGTQTIKGVTTSGISASNVKAGVSVKVGDSNNASRIVGVTGTFTSDANATSGDMLSGKTGYVNGAKITGTIPSKAAATYNTSGSDQTISSGQYLSGAQTVRGVTTANISAGNIKAGVTVKVGDAADDDRIVGVAGTFTSDANAVAGDMLSGKTAYVNGSKVTGNISSKAATTYNTSSSDQTIAAGQYLSGAQTIRKVTTANMSAANIKAGVTIKVGDVGDDDRIAGVTGTFTSDANAAAGDMLSGKTAYVNGSKVTGSISSKAAATYNTSASDQTISAGQYLSGAQTIRKVTTSGITAGNIKAGAVVKVGDAADDDRIAGVTGTFTSDANAAAGDILSGKTAYVNGSKVTGSIASKAATTYNTSTSDQEIAAGQYLSGTQTIRKVTTTNLSAANIKQGVTVKVGDAGDDDRVASVTGTFTSDATAAATDILPSKTAYVNGSKLTGTMTTKAAATYNVSSSDQTISAGQYLSGAQTIRKVTTSNINSGNIKAGVTIKVGDAGDDDRIAGVTGTFTSDATASAADILPAKTAYVNGNKITGSMSTKSAATYNTSTSDQYISAGQYLSEAQTIKAVTTSNIDAANIKYGVNVKVGDANNAGRIKNITGTCPYVDAPSSIVPFIIASYSFQTDGSNGSINIEQSTSTSVVYIDFTTKGTTGQASAEWFGGRGIFTGSFNVLHAYVVVYVPMKLTVTFSRYQSTTYPSATFYPNVAYTVHTYITKNNRETPQFSISGGSGSAAVSLDLLYNFRSWSWAT